MSPIDYLIMSVVHRTNEDWHLELPLDAETLEGATVMCQLVNTSGNRINFQAGLVSDAITLDAQSEVFAGKTGHYSGDVLLTLEGGQDVVTHLINLELVKGVSQRA